jgi:hypothetical protein
MGGLFFDILEQINSIYLNKTRITGFCHPDILTDIPDYVPVRYIPQMIPLMKGSYLIGGRNLVCLMDRNNLQWFNLAI